MPIPLASSIVQVTLVGAGLKLTMGVREAWEQLPSLRRVIWKRAANETLCDARDADWHELCNSGKDAATLPDSADANHPFMVIYTSGTTGKPKGVVHTHGSFPIKIARDAVVHFDVHPTDVFCWPADLGWIAGTLVLGCALLRGATLVCYDGAPDFPNWSGMSRSIERHKITQFGSAPTLIRGMASNEATALLGDRATLRLLITAREGIDPEHFNSLAAISQARFALRCWRTLALTSSALIGWVAVKTGGSCRSPTKVMAPSLCKSTGTSDPSRSISIARKGATLCANCCSTPMLSLRTCTSTRWSPSGWTTRAFA